MITPARVFVFGSNLAGRHGAGAARTARQIYGAVYGVGRGPTGRAYALPTKDEHLRPLPLSEIGFYAREFLRYALDHPELEFLVTRVGCGLAGYTDQQIAPLFRYAASNCLFAPEWAPYLKK